MRSLDTALSDRNVAILRSRPLENQGNGRKGDRLFSCSLIFVPNSYDPERPSPVAVMLHGAGGNARRGMDLLRRHAEEHRLILIAPASFETTWDVIARGEFGPDVVEIDADLQEVFTNYTVDAAHLAIGGFSDGASYSLSLGVINGGLFTHILAFSPGFAVPTAEPDPPRVFISHGDEDQILQIDRCSRRIVPMLQGAGYDVRYHEFHGRHEIPPLVVQEALDWFLA